MKLEGLHGITMLTADARQSAELHADVLGRPTVEKTATLEQPDARRGQTLMPAGDPRPTRRRRVGA